MNLRFNWSEHVRNDMSGSRSGWESKLPASLFRRADHPDKHIMTWDNPVVNHTLFFIGCHLDNLCEKMELLSLRMLLTKIRAKEFHKRGENFDRHRSPAVTHFFHFVSLTQLNSLLSLSLFQNKEFVYRGLEFEKLPAFTQRIAEEFPGAQILPSNTQPDKSLRTREGQFVQVLCIQIVWRWLHFF